MTAKKILKALMLVIIVVCVLYNILLVLGAIGDSFYLKNGYSMFWHSTTFYTRGDTLCGLLAGTVQGAIRYVVINILGLASCLFIRKV